MSGPYRGRRERVWQSVLGQAPDACGLLITSLPNIRYLTGFSGSNAVLLVTEDQALLGTDARYAVQSDTECPGVPVLLDRSTLAAVAAHWRKHFVGPLAVESEHVSLAQWRRIVEMLDGDERRLRTISGVVESVREVKDPDELAALEWACAISGQALEEVISDVRTGDTERTIARRLDSRMLELGADRVSFDTIVASGPHSAIPHHQPTDRPLREGDLLLIDFGAEVAGYHADETRTFVVGEPVDWQREIHAVVLAAQQAGRAAATAGTPLADVDGAARRIIDEAGYGDHFGHGLGHGVGLEIHEAPFVSAAATGMLLAGSSVTIEPGVYLAGRGGVRIEDTVIVTEGQCSPLTTADRGLLVLG